MSLPRYPEYKDSGDLILGRVPEHWSLCPLKAVVDTDNSGCYGLEPDESEIQLPVATTAQIDSQGRFDVANMPVRGFTRAEARRYGCSAGDILVVKSSGSATNIISGKSGLVDQATDKFVFSNFLLRLKPRTIDVLPSFLYRVISSSITRERVQLMCSSTTYPNLKVGEYISATIPLPSMQEQTAIATFLDRETAKIDALIAEQEKLLTLLAEKRQATISHAVTKGLNPDAPMKDSGVEWLGEVPAHWEFSRLKFAASVQTGVAKGKDTTGKDTIEVAYLRVANVQDGYLDLEDIATIEIPVADLPRYRLQRGDVLMNEGGDFDKLGRGHIWDGEIEVCIHQNHVFAVRPRGVSSEWLNRITSSDYAQFYFMTRSKQSTNLASISSTNVMELPLLLPSEAEQNAILRFIDSETARLDNLSAEATRAIDLLKERRTALISAAVTGKIDVRNA